MKKISFQSINDTNKLIKCPICLEETTDNYVSKCNHGVCIYCLKTMINSGINSCPLCRKYQNH